MVLGEEGDALRGWVSSGNSVWSAWGDAGGPRVQIRAVDVVSGEVKALLRAYDAEVLFQPVRYVVCYAAKSLGQDGPTCGS